VYIGIYRFDGEPDELLAAYDRLVAMVPLDGSAFHLCVPDEGGITIYDTCPSREAFEGFSTGAGFHAALRQAGLPEPRIEGRPVHAAFANGVPRA
jgi:hypothetical protein